MRPKSGCRRAHKLRRCPPWRRGFPVLVFDEASIPVEYQFEVFHDTTAPLFDTRPLSRAASTHAGAIDYLVDDLVVSRLRYGAQVLRRRPDHTSVAGDCLAVQLYYRGGLRGRHR